MSYVIVRNEKLTRDEAKGRDSYRTLQNNFYDYITSKGFVKNSIWEQKII